jgi:hypothetical protein
MTAVQPFVRHIVLLTVHCHVFAITITICRKLYENIVRCIAALANYSFIAAQAHVTGQLNTTYVAALAAEQLLKQ